MRGHPPGHLNVSENIKNGLGDCLGHIQISKKLVIPAFVGMTTKFLLLDYTHALCL